MIKQAMLSALVLATLAGSTLSTVSQAQAQQYDNQQWQHHGDWRGPPPPRDDRHHHHHNNGGVIAGGIAAGVIGGILGGAIANGNGGYAPPPPPPECWFERRPVQDQYDDGWHYERVRVCN